jgi:ATP-dependent DNA ligase
MGSRTGTEERNSVEILSRNNKDLGRKFPELLEACRSLDCADAILDGEIVALDEEGRSSFQLLQAYEMGEEHPPLSYYLFDLSSLTEKTCSNSRSSNAKRTWKTARRAAGVAPLLGEYRRASAQLCAR